MALFCLRMSGWFQEKMVSGTLSLANPVRGESAWRPAIWLPVEKLGSRNWGPETGVQKLGSECNLRLGRGAEKRGPTGVGAAERLGQFPAATALASASRTALTAHADTSTTRLRNNRLGRTSRRRWSAGHACAIRSEVTCPARNRDGGG